MILALRLALKFSLLTLATPSSPERQQMAGWPAILAFWILGHQRARLISDQPKAHQYPCKGFVSTSMEERKSSYSDWKLLPLSAMLLVIPLFASCPQIFVHNPHWESQSQGTSSQLQSEKSQEGAICRPCNLTPLPRSWKTKTTSADFECWWRSDGGQLLRFLFIYLTHILPPSLPGVE